MKRGWYSRVAAAAVLIALAVLSASLVPPPDTAGLESHPRPARDYDEALARWDALERRDLPAVSPACRSRRLDHGGRARNVLVLFHGLTNCPRQFEQLGERFHASGWNVLIARIPRHGLADRMTGDLAGLDAAELTRFTDEVIDIADGFGARVTVVGLSLGGVMAAWAGQERADVDRAVVIAPMFGVASVARAYTAALARALLALPNRFIWWDPRAKQAVPGPVQAYPRFATRALGETLRLGFKVERDAKARPPAARRMVMVSVGNDPAVNNRSAANLAELWKRAGARVETFEFPARLALNHDLIDPEQVHARTDIVYPLLERLIRP